MELFAGFDYFIQHFFRKGNQVANALAKGGALGENKLFTDWLQFPREIRGLYRLDKMARHMLDVVGNCIRLFGGVEFFGFHLSFIVFVYKVSLRHK